MHMICFALGYNLKLSGATIIFIYFPIHSRECQKVAISPRARFWISNFAHNTHQKYSLCIFININIYDFYLRKGCQHFLRYWWKLDFNHEEH